MWLIKEWENIIFQDIKKIKNLVEMIQWKKFLKIAQMNILIKCIANWEKIIMKIINVKLI